METYVWERLTLPATSYIVRSMEHKEFKRLNAVNARNARDFLAADRKYRAAHYRYKQENSGVGSNQVIPMNDEMFDAHMARKKAMYAFAITDVPHRQYAEQFGVDRDALPVTSYTHYEKELEHFEVWQKSTPGSEEVKPGGYESGRKNPNPSMNGFEGNRYYNEAIDSLSAFSGISVRELLEQVYFIMETEKVSRHTATQKLYLSLEKRQDKPFVYLDFETAARDVEDIGTVDQGHYSEIIEVGYIKQYPNGTSEENTFLLDMDETLKELAGTGAEHIHNISPDMIAGKQKFSDPEIQEKMQEVLWDSVIVAHSAVFEDIQLTWNLRNYAMERSHGNIEVLDSKIMTAVFIHTENGNRNQDLVEVTGLQYGDDAHRALADAKMTMNALGTVLDNRKYYMYGIAESVIEEEFENNKKGDSVTTGRGSTVGEIEYLLDITDKCPVQASTFIDRYVESTSRNLLSATTEYL